MYCTCLLSLSSFTNSFLLFCLLFMYEKMSTSPKTHTHTQIDNDSTLMIYRLVLLYSHWSIHCLNISPCCLMCLCVCSLPLGALRRSTVCCLHYWKEESVGHAWVDTEKRLDRLPHPGFNLVHARLLEWKDGSVNVCDSARP